MIVPGKKLVFWFGVVAAPFAALAGLIPESAGAALGAMTLFALAAALDALRAQKVLDGVSVTLPDSVKASTGRRVRLPLTIHHPGKHGLTLRLGMRFPNGIVPESPDLLAALPPGGEASMVYWPVTPSRTGRHILAGVHLEAASPLGLWMVRAKAPAKTQLCVFPNLIQEKDGLASLFLRTSLGRHAQRQVGQGRDFDQLREYAPGDSFADIHWKATAKRGRPVTKVFQIERTQEIYVILDASRLSSRTMPTAMGREVSGPEGEWDRNPAILERFVTSALVLGLAAQRLGDMFGLVTFADKVETFIRARSGKIQYNACRDALFTLTPRVVSPDYAELFAFLGNTLRRRALLLFLTNLDDPALAGDFIKQASLVGRRHLVVVNSPHMAGVRPLFSSPDVKTLDDVYDSMAGHLLWENVRKTQKELHRMGVGFNWLENERMCAQLVTQYITIKQRQMI